MGLLLWNDSKHSLLKKLKKNEVPNNDGLIKFLWVCFCCQARAAESQKPAGGSPLTHTRVTSPRSKTFFFFPLLPVSVLQCGRFIPAPHQEGQTVKSLLRKRLSTWKPTFEQEPVGQLNIKPLLFIYLLSHQRG